MSAQTANRTQVARFCTSTNSFCSWSWEEFFRSFQQGIQQLRLDQSVQKWWFIRTTTRMISDGGAKFILLESLLLFHSHRSCQKGCRVSALQRIELICQGCGISWEECQTEKLASGFQHRTLLRFGSKFGTWGLAPLVPKARSLCPPSDSTQLLLPIPWLCERLKLQSALLADRWLSCGLSVSFEGLWLTRYKSPALSQRQKPIH